MNVYNLNFWRDIYSEIATLLNLPHSKVPSYWWDYGNGKTIIVKSDHRRFPIIGVFPYEDFADDAITLANKLIEDLKCGRKTPEIPIVQMLPINHSTTYALFTVSEREYIRELDFSETMNLMQQGYSPGSELKYCNRY